jgi:FixJ family two-component response regulator
MSRICACCAIVTSLSRREREVMVLVITGLLNKQVAAQLDISEITVKSAPRAGDAQNEREIARRSGENGRSVATRFRGHLNQWRTSDD